MPCTRSDHALTVIKAGLNLIRCSAEHSRASLEITCHCRLSGRLREQSSYWRRI